LVLDCEGREFIPFAGFEGTLVRLYKKLWLSESKLRMCNVHQVAVETFRVNGIITLMSIYRTLEEAIDDLRKSSQNSPRERE
jgi:hypothetical protein